MKQSGSTKVKDRAAAVRDILKANGFEGGKLPPQALDLEEAVLGALMIDGSVINKAIDILKPDSFYNDAHQRIFKAITDLFSQSKPIDLLTVKSQLQFSGELELAGGSGYLSKLTTRVASAANIETHARIIAQKYIQRELVRISGEILRDAFEDTTDVFELLDKAEKDLFSVAEANMRRQFSEMNHLIHQVMENIEAARKTGGGLSGVPSGFSALDRVTAGWQPSDMIVVAARPGMGKTAFVLSMARNMAVEHQVPVAVFSLEMSSVQLVQRLVASEAQIAADKLRKGNLADFEYAQLHKRIARLSDAPIFIDDTPGLSAFELRAKLRRMKHQFGIQLAVIDYLQLMHSGGDNKGGNREQEISTISRSIKSIAKELNIPIIALSQLSRSVETRGGEKRPILSDLRESGAIEQDADIVCFIYRPEYYGMTVDEAGNSTEGIGEIIVAKHRNGALETVKLRFVGKFARFENLEGPPMDIDALGGLQPNTDFDRLKTMTKQSRMNEDLGGDMETFSTGNAGDVPF